jgi:hypothetical protein
MKGEVRLQICNLSRYELKISFNSYLSALWFVIHVIEYFQS